LLLSSYVKYPIIVDVRTLTTLDGHNRYNASKRLGLRCMPAFLVDYTEDYVDVYPLKKDIPVSKVSIISVALKGIVYPQNI